MSRSVSCRGSFEVELDPATAMRLFTPEGERAWVEGWDPSYPDPAADPDAPGTVFLTAGHEGGQTVWLITHADAMERRYARFDPRGIAAVIEVSCAPGAAGSAVEVGYTLTAVEAGHEDELREFAEGYDAYMEEWRTAIEAAIADGRIPAGDA